MPEITNAVNDVAETLGRLIDASLPREKTPVVDAFSIGFVRFWLAVLGLMAIPALEPVAEIFALTLTLLEAVNVSVVFALQLTPSLIFRSPLPLCDPEAL